MIECYQRMKDDAFTVDPDSKRPVSRAILAPNVIIDASKPKTLGALADKNTEQAIKDGKIKPKKKYRPWWRPKSDKTLNIKGWTKKDKETYIATGNKPKGK